jgi:hypothetical protein
LIPLGVAVIAAPILARVLSELPDTRDAARHGRSPAKVEEPVTIRRPAEPLIDDA